MLLFPAITNICNAKKITKQKQKAKIPSDRIEDKKRYCIVTHPLDKGLLILASHCLTSHHCNFMFKRHP
jgi:hypothetical protein